MNKPDIAYFQKSLLEWWRSGGARSFTWRLPERRSAYGALVAEMMLRRTRAEQVQPIYEDFLARYPDLGTALVAHPDELRESLRSLGLQWRIDGFTELLNTLRDSIGQDIPEGIERLRELPGVGEYVSNAIACFAFEDASATLIDTNVVRVIGRFFGLDTSGEARRRRDVRDAATRAVDRTQVADYHYAILDLAGTICRPKPGCESCPLGTVCHFKGQTVVS